MASILPTEPTMLLGRHHLAELTGCEPERIGKVSAVEPAFLHVLVESGATILSHSSHQFKPAGATVVVLLAESHASLHTWPERGAMCIDFFTCSDAMDVGLALERLAVVFGASRVTRQIIDRKVPG